MPWTFSPFFWPSLIATSKVPLAGSNIASPVKSRMYSSFVGSFVQYIRYSPSFTTNVIFCLASASSICLPSYSIHVGLRPPTHCTPRRGATGGGAGQTARPRTPAARGGAPPPGRARHGPRPPAARGGRGGGGPPPYCPFYKTPQPGLIAWEGVYTAARRR